MKNNNIFKRIIFPLISKNIPDDSCDYNMFLAAEKFAEKNTIFIDIGANIGLFSFNIIRNGFRCIAFEPHPEYFKILCRRKFWFDIERIFKSNLGELSIDNTAISSGESSQKLWHHDSKPGSHSLDRDRVIQENGNPHDSYIVKLNSLDKVFNNKKFDKDQHFFIKIDVEGHEKKVIDGGIEFIKKYKPDIFVEVSSSKTHNSLLEIKETLSGYGYKLLIHDKFRTSSSHELFTEVNNIDVIFSCKKKECVSISCGYPYLSKTQKIRRLFKRIFFLQLSELNYEAISKPYDVFY